MEAGFIGQYGEWYYSKNYGTSSLTAQNIADRKEIGLKILELAPDRMVAFRTPTFQTLVGGATPISQTFLDNIKTDFNSLRAAGVKCILRFRYSESDDIEAPKALLLSHIEQLKAITIPNQDVISLSLIHI